MHTLDRSYGEPLAFGALYNVTYGNVLLELVGPAMWFLEFLPPPGRADRNGCVNSEFTP